MVWPIGTCGCHSVFPYSSFPKAEDGLLEPWTNGYVSKHEKYGHIFSDYVSKKMCSQAPNMNYW